MTWTQDVGQERFAKMRNRFWLNGWNTFEILLWILLCLNNCYKQCLNSGRASWQNRGGHNRWDNRTGANNWGNNRNKFQNRNNYGRNNYWRRNRYGNDGRCYTLSPLNRYFTFHRNQIAPLERHTRARHAPPNEETKFFATRTRPEMGCGRFCGSNTPL